MMKRFLSFLRRHVAALLTLALLLSLLGNLIQWQMSVMERTYSIVGSYSAAPGSIPVPENEYLVFEQEGSYCRYRQYELLETGSYRQNEVGDSYAMTPDTPGFAPWCVVYAATVRDQPAVVYGLHPSDAQSVMWTKYADIPSYINIKHDGPIGPQTPEIIADSRKHG